MNPVELGKGQEELSKTKPEESLRSLAGVCLQLWSLGQTEYCPEIS